MNIRLIECPLKRRLETVFEEYFWKKIFIVQNAQNHVIPCEDRTDTYATDTIPALNLRTPCPIASSLKILNT